MQEDIVEMLLVCLNSTFNLCDYHPFDSQIVFDFAAFDSTDTAVHQPEVDDGGSSNVPYSLYEHITSLVDELENPVSRPIRSVASERGETAVTAFPDRKEIERTSRRQPVTTPPQVKTNSDSASHATGLEVTAPGSSSTLDKNGPAGKTTKPKNISLEQLGWLNKISETIHILEQNYVKNVFPNPEGPSGSVRTNTSSQNMLAKLTQSLWDEQITRSGGPRDVDNYLLSKARSPGQNNPQTNNVAQNGGTHERQSPPTTQKNSNGVQKSRGKVTQLPKLTEGLSPSTTTAYPPSGVEGNNNPLTAPDYLFNDIGRFETLKVADLLSEYLQEQAHLHGVDLS